MSLLKKALIQDNKEQLNALEGKIDGLTNSVRLAVYMFDGVESIDIKMANERLKELTKEVGKYLLLKAAIK